MEEDIKRVDGDHCDGGITAKAEGEAGINLFGFTEYLIH
jgi:hypothetical protein